MDYFFFVYLRFGLAQIQRVILFTLVKIFATYFLLMEMPIFYEHKAYVLEQLLMKICFC